MRHFIASLAENPDFIRSSFAFWVNRDGTKARVMGWAEPAPGVVELSAVEASQLGDEWHARDVNDRGLDADPSDLRAYRQRDIDHEELQKRLRVYRGRGSVRNG